MRLEIQAQKFFKEQFGGFSLYILGVGLVMRVENCARVTWSYKNNKMVMNCLSGLANEVKKHEPVKNMVTREFSNQKLALHEMRNVQ